MDRNEPTNPKLPQLEDFGILHWNIKGLKGSTGALKLLATTLGAECLSINETQLDDTAINFVRVAGFKLGSHS